MPLFVSVSVPIIPNFLYALEHPLEANETAMAILEQQSREREHHRAMRNLSCYVFQVNITIHGPVFV